MNGIYIRKAYRELLATIDACMYCGCSGANHIDHIFPKNRGGNSELSNLTKACAWCNGIKGDCYMEDFYERISKRAEQARYRAGKAIRRLRKLRRSGGNAFEIIETIETIYNNRKAHSRCIHVLNSIYHEKYIINYEQLN